MPTSNARLSISVLVQVVALTLLRNLSPDLASIPPEVLAVPKNMKLLAVPLFELYDNSQRYVLPFHADRLILLQSSP